MELYPTTKIKYSHRIPTVKLLPIEPIFDTDGEIEALSSYIVRVAEAHWVSPVQLLYCLRQSFSKDKTGKVQIASNFDIFSKASVELIDNMKFASSINFDFRNLTLNSWHDIYPSAKGHGITSHNLRWCNLCHAECEKNQQPIYNKLAWSLQPVEACVIHCAILSDQCAVCTTKQKYITPNSFVGFCHHCGSKLHSVDAVRRAKEKQLWIAQSCDHLIKNSRAGNIFRSSDLLANIEDIVDNHFGGQPRRIAKELNMHHTVRSWFRGAAPNFSLLLDFCYRIQVHPAELFSRTRTFVAIEQKFDTKKPYRSVPYLTDKQIQNISQNLNEILRENEELTTAEDIAKKVGISKRVMQNRFPKQYRQVVKKVKLRLQREFKERNLERIRKIEVRAKILVENNTYPGQRQLLKDPSILASDIRIPFVKKALKKIQAKARNELNLS